MNTHAPVAPSALQISNISVRQDADGRYCLNDLHKAAIANGSNARTKEPTKFLSSSQAIELINELDTQNLGVMSVSTIKGRSKQQGTYVAKELVYLYAMWISASFSLKVIRAYDALQSQPKAPPSTSSIETFQVRVLTTFTRGDQPTQQIVPYDACVVSGTDLLHVKTFLNESVSIELIPEILEAVSQRMARHFKYLEQSAVAK